MPIEEIVEGLITSHIEKITEFDSDEYSPSDMMLSLAKEQQAKGNWDTPHEMWFSLNLSGTVSFWRIFSFYLHPIELMKACPPAPEGSGILLLDEGWFLNTADLDEGDNYENWIGRVGDHIKAKETRQLVHLTPDNEFYFTTEIRRRIDIDVHGPMTGDDVQGAVPKAMLKFKNGGSVNDARHSR